jgi:hypothetical protein
MFVIRTMHWTMAYRSFSLKLVILWNRQVFLLSVGLPVGVEDELATPSPRLVKFESVILREKENY